jgi:anti-sigma regulatory factor (Ser/Thr protein kinase)
MTVCIESAASVHEMVELPALVEQLEAVRLCITHFWAATERRLAYPLPVQLRQEFETAVIEIANNIVRHAYPPSAAAATMWMELTYNRCCIVAHFIDSGVPFTRSLPSTRAEMPDPLELPERGWGLQIVHALVDELSYTRNPDGTNHWRLRKVA